MTKKKATLYGYLFCMPFIIFFSLFVLVPLVFSVVISFTNWNGITMKFIGWQNYSRILKDPYFKKSIFNTFTVLVLICTTLTVLASLVLTYFLNFKLRKASKFMQMITLIPYFTSTVAVGAIFSFLFNKNIGIVNNLLVSWGLLESASIDWLGSPLLAKLVIVLINLWTYIGYTSIFFIAGLTGISDEIIDAARVDGAKEPRIFVSICMPMLKNVTYFVITTSVIGAFQQLEQEFMMYNGGIFGSNFPVGGPEGAIMTMGLNFYNTSFVNFQYGYGATIGICNAVVIGIVSIILARVLKRRA